MGRFVSELNPLRSAGDFDFFVDVCLPFLTNWLNVGIIFTSCGHSMPNTTAIGFMPIFDTLDYYTSHVYSLSSKKPDSLRCPA